MQKSLYGPEIKSSELRDSVAMERIELEQVKGGRKLQAIVEDQVRTNNLSINFWHTLHFSVALCDF